MWDLEGDSPGPQIAARPAAFLRQWQRLGYGDVLEHGILVADVLWHRMSRTLSTC